MASGRRRISRSQSVGCRLLFQGCGYGDTPYGNDPVGPFPTMSYDQGELDKQPEAIYTYMGCQHLGIRIGKNRSVP